MPAVSKSQQIVMAIAEHDPSRLNASNRGVLNMTHDQLHDFASTPRKGLPKHVKGSLNAMANSKKKRTK